MLAAWIETVDRHRLSTTGSHREHKIYSSLTNISSEIRIAALEEGERA